MVQCGKGAALRKRTAAGVYFWHYRPCLTHAATPTNGEYDVTSEDSVQGLARRLAEAIPRNIRTAGEDIERNFRTVLRSGLGKMNLVSREEFDVQAAVLARTRQKLEALEKSLAALEAQAAEPAAAAPRKKTAAKKAATGKAADTKAGED